MTEMTMMRKDHPMTTTETTTTRTLQFATRDPLVRALSNGLLFAEKDMTLPHIAGVRFEFDGTNLTTVSTDRYRLCVETVDYMRIVEVPVIEEGRSFVRDEPVTVDPFVFLLPRAAATAALKMLKAATKVEQITLTFDTEVAVLSLSTSFGSSSQWRTDTDSTFPPYQHLIPSVDATEPVDEISFNPVYLADLGKVQVDGRIGIVKIRTYGMLKPVRVDYADGPNVVLMPLRDSR